MKDISITIDKENEVGPFQYKVFLHGGNLNQYLRYLLCIPVLAFSISVEFARRDALSPFVAAY